PGERVLAAATVIAREAGTAHVGTEHLLAALIRHGHPEVVTLLAERGGTAEAADALLTGLAGGPGVEAPPEPLPGTLLDALPGTRRAGVRPVSRRLAFAALVCLLVGTVILVVCVLGPIFGP